MSSPFGFAATKKKKLTRQFENGRNVQKLAMNTTEAHLLIKGAISSNIFFYY